ITREGLAEGEEADFMLLDASHPSMNPVHTAETVISHLVYSGEYLKPRFLIVGGKLIIKEGVLTTVDEKEVVREGVKAARDLIERGP
ncbi:MAG: hypothetical protein N3H31_07850, partial [Candidatus Nezhaarchaeota archaeon]|nr:hypothetical protein [Candidatus Nezhaarchaeota archaeon]